jgi:hypothetical protein
LALAVAITATVPLVAACSGDDESEPDGGALVIPFGEMVDGLYSDAGRDRDEDFDRGVLTETCPVFDDEDAVALARALGVENADDATVVGDNTYVSGPPQSEVLGCTIRLNEDDAFFVSLGTTAVDRDGFLDVSLEEEFGEEVEEIDDDAPGLDPDHVAGILRDGDAPIAVWITEGFQVGVNLPDGVASPQGAMNALAIAVEAVAAALG